MLINFRMNKSFLNRLSNPFVLKESHFLIGENIHTETFINIKLLLEDSEKVKEICNYFSEKISSDYPLEMFSKLTLISNEVFSNLLLSKIVSALSNKGYECNYGIYYDRLRNIYDQENTQFLLQETDGLIKQFDFTPKKTVVLILPIVSTFKRLFRFKKKLESKLGKTIANTSYAVVFYSDRQPDNTNNTHPLSDGLFVKYFQFVFGSLPNAHTCAFCYPELSKDESSQKLILERYLYPINRSTATQNLIMGWPNYGLQLNLAGEQDFNECFKFNDNNEEVPAAIIFSNILPNKLNPRIHYLQYVLADIFYSNNRNKILTFFNQNLKPHFQGKEVVIITTEREYSTTIIEDIFLGEEFKDIKHKVITYQPFLEHIDNFEYLYKDYISDALGKKLIVFYSDVIFNGSDFKEINTFLRKINSRGFDLIFCIIDRTTPLSRQRILIRLDEKGRENLFYSYFKLNVPLERGHILSNPIFAREQILRNELEDCHLDGLKIYLINKIKKCRPTTKEDVFSSFKNNDWIKSLIKLNIHHNLNTEFATAVESQRQTNNEVDPQIFLSLLLEDKLSVFSDAFFQEKKTWKQEYEDFYKDCFIKTLCRSPFSFYEKVYSFMFSHIIKELEIITGSTEPIDCIAKLRRLKFFVRRSVELNSNYIISKKFILYLRDLFYQTEKNILYNHKEEEVGTFKYFLLNCYKELIKKDINRSLRIEVIINKEINLRPGSFDSSIAKDLLDDKYWGFLRLLKVENIDIISKYSDKYDFTKLTENTLSFDNINSYDNHYLLKCFMANSYYKPLSTTCTIYKIYDTVKKLVTSNQVSSSDSNIDIDKKIRGILENINDLMKQNDPDNSSVYHCMLFVDFKKKVDDNKFYLISTLDNDWLDTQPSKDGLVFNLFKGMHERGTQLQQTILPVLKTAESKYISYSAQYIDKTESEKDINICVESDARDFNIIRNSEMLYFLRLTQLENDELNPRAILVIGRKSVINNHDSFLKFLGIEKIRLLLSLKETIVKYLDDIISSKSFEEMLEIKTRASNNDTTTHGLDRYLRVLNDNDTSPLIKLTKNIILSQYFSQKEISKNEVYEPAMLTNIINIICSEEKIGYKQITHQRLKNLSAIKNPLEWNLIYIVVPEIIINMKKNSPYGNSSELIFEISYNGKDNFLRFSNSCLETKKDFNADAYFYATKGLGLCRKVLRKMGYWGNKSNSNPIQITYAAETKPWTLFETTLFLNKN
jgi:hypothetical protein